MQKERLRKVGAGEKDNEDLFPQKGCLETSKHSACPSSNPPRPQCSHNLAASELSDVANSQHVITHTSEVQVKPRPFQ